MTTSPILQPVTIGNLHLKINRHRDGAADPQPVFDAGVPPDFAADYYGQRASAGLIVSEDTNISQQPWVCLHAGHLVGRADRGLEAHSLTTVHATTAASSSSCGTPAGYPIPTCNQGGELPVSASAVSRRELPSRWRG